MVKRCWLAPAVLIVLVPCACAKKSAKATTSTEPAPIVAGPDNTRPPIGNISPAAGRTVPTNDLQQFALIYLTDSLTQVPRSLKDMPDVRRDMPKAYPAFEDGRYVVCWGADPNRAPAGASNTVLAYEKATPEKGGVVAFLDGSVRNVTAADFKQFAKPGAK